MMFDAKIIASTEEATVWDVRGSVDIEAVLCSSIGAGPVATARSLLSKMLMVRRFEESLVDLARQGRIVGALHTSIGQEATAVGICAALGNGDIITGTHRSHGHLLAKGSPPSSLMAELFGKVTGVCRGRGGSMHVADASVGCLGASGIVGGGLPLAVGAALASVLRRDGNIAVGFFGDGSANQGMVHEAMNLSAVWGTPTLFACENNGYAVSTSVDQGVAGAHLAHRALAYGFDGCIVDGQNVVEVLAVARLATGRVRKERRPFLIEAKTYRYRDHNEGMPDLGYRSATEIEDWKNNRDPITLFIEAMTSSNILSEQDIEEIAFDVEGVISDAISFAVESPAPAPEDVYEDLYE